MSTLKEIERTEDLRVKLLRAELDGNATARVRILRKLLSLTGADPDKMDLTPMPTNRPAEVVSRMPRKADLLVRNAAAALAILWCAWGTYGCLRPISDATAAKVGQAQGAAIHAGHVPLGVGWQGERSRQWRETGRAFGWQS